MSKASRKGLTNSEKWSQTEIEDFKKLIASFTERGDYKGALPIAKRALKENPHELQVRFNYAKILGDWADELPQARKRKLKAEAIAILRPLLRSLSGQPPLDRFGISLNYYYQSESWKRMYDFGKRFERFHKQKALYAQGLAATSQAFDLHSRGQGAMAARWAQKAIAAWKRYDFRRERYYFPVYNYAKALALSGDLAAARKQLERAAKMSSRTVADWEFADVVALL